MQKHTNSALLSPCVHTISRTRHRDCCKHTARLGEDEGLTSNTSPCHTVWAAGAVLGALGSIVGVGDDSVRVCHEADEAIGVLQSVHACGKHANQSAAIPVLPWILNKSITECGHAMILFNPVPEPRKSGL